MDISIARVVIVGAGHAGGSMASLLRQYGYQGHITLLGDEPVAPYQRPPLSKAWLNGEAQAADLFLKPLNYYTEQNIDLRMDARVAGIDTRRQLVTLIDGETVAYDHLVLACGARARKLEVPGHELSGIVQLRDMADAERLKTGLGQARKIGIIGGGYIGLEVAASARAQGVEVVVLEREPRLLSRVASLPISEFFLQFHQRRGVQFQFGVEVAAIEGLDGRVSGIRLSDNSLIDCDLVLVGIGGIPNDEIASAAGLECDGGVIVDAESRTSVHTVFAIGDIAKRPISIYGQHFRLESVPNALEQAKQVASVLTGRSLPRQDVPWFWSDQYGVKLQIAGIAFDADHTIVRGSPEAGKFTIFHFRQGKMLAAEAINSPGDFLAAKKGILSGKLLDTAQISDSGVSMMPLFA